MSRTGEPVGSELASATGAVVGMGGAATAAAVSACCAGPTLGPLTIALFGAGGAVALENARPYTLALLIVSGIATGVALWLSVRAARRCDPQRRSPAFLRMASRAFVWVAAAVWVASVAAVIWARFG